MSETQAGFGNMFIGSSDDVALAAAIVLSLLGEPVERVTPLVGKGLVNKVFVVEASSRRVVVRMSDRPEAPDEYAKEAWCIERAAARGVPTPVVLGVGLRGGHAYLVEAFVEGGEGRDSTAVRTGVWHALGEHARLIHSIPVPGFGLRLSEITEGDAQKSWTRYLEYNIESLSEADPLIGLKVVTPAESRAIREVFVGLRGREFTFGLNHGDLSLKNTIVDARGRVTLLDWGSAEAAVVPHHDLIQLLKMSMSEGDPGGVEFGAFLDGYGISPAELERMTPELDGLLTLRAFDKLRWAIEWKVEPLSGFVRHAREAVSLCLRRG